MKDYINPLVTMPFPKSILFFFFASTLPHLTNSQCTHTHTTSSWIHFLIGAGRGRYVSQSKATVSPSHNHDGELNCVNAKQGCKLIHT